MTFQQKRTSITVGGRIVSADQFAAGQDPIDPRPASDAALVATSVQYLLLEVPTTSDRMKATMGGAQDGEVATTLLIDTMTTGRYLNIP
jgi:hypothetical protein